MSEDLPSVSCEPYFIEIDPDTVGILTGEGYHTLDQALGIARPLMISGRRVRSIYKGANVVLTGKELAVALGEGTQPTFENFPR